MGFEATKTIEKCTLNRKSVDVIEESSKCNDKNGRYINTDQNLFQCTVIKEGSILNSKLIHRS